MKRIKLIFSALSTLRRVPSAAISDAWAGLKSGVTAGADADSNDVSSANLDLIDSLIAAIVAIAKDDEDKATSAGKADKP